jgi:hypothetical protein
MPPLLLGGDQDRAGPSAQSVLFRCQDGHVVELFRAIQTGAGLLQRRCRQHRPGPGAAEFRFDQSLLQGLHHSGHELFGSQPGSCGITDRYPARKRRQGQDGAGYAPDEYSLVVQKYVSPLPRSADISYSEAGFSRQSTYGCGFWNADLEWAAGTAVPAINSTIASGVAASGFGGVQTVDVGSLFNGHELCAATTKKLNDTPLPDWRVRVPRT